VESSEEPICMHQDISYDCSISNYYTGCRNWEQGDWRGKCLTTLEFMNLAATEICGTTKVRFFSEIGIELKISPAPHYFYQVDGSLLAKDLSCLLLAVFHRGTVKVKGL